MNEFLKKISFKQKLLIYSTTLIVALVYLSINYYLASTKKSARNNYFVSIRSIQTQSLQLANTFTTIEKVLEKDEAFFENNENKYIADYKQNIHNLSYQIDELMLEAHTKRYETTVLLSEIQAEIAKNIKLLDRYLDLLKDRGDQSTGMLGQLNSTIEILQDKVEGHEVGRDIELLIEYQQNYIYSGNSAYINRFNDLYGEVAEKMQFTSDNVLLPDSSMYDLALSENEMIGDSILIEELQISTDSVQIETQTTNRNRNTFADGFTNQNKDIYIIRQINNLKNHFASVIAINYNIGLTDKEGVRGEIYRSFNRFAALFTKTESLVDEKTRWEMRKNTVWLIGHLTLVLAVIFAMFIYLYKYIMSRAAGLVQNLEKISVGEIPENVEISNEEDTFDQMLMQYNKVLSGLREKLKFVTAIKENRNDSNFHPLSDNDQLGLSLIDLRNSLISSKEAEDKLKQEESDRNWINLGITKFSDILRQTSNNLRDLGYNVIFELVKYMSINQGGIFYINDEDKSDKYLEMLSAYAYDRRKFKQRRIEIGEGMLGTCIKEKKTSHYTNIPDKYIEITSGLGHSTPQNLLIVPLIFEDEVYGAIEMASFRKFKKHEIEFAEKVAESVATTLSTMKINIRTSKLLEQSNDQSEAMIAQEEEMRQNLEELIATNEEMERKERESANFVEAINKSAYTLRMDFKGYILEINEILLNIHGYSRNDIEDYSIYEIDKFKIFDVKLFDSIKNKLQGGIPYKHIVHRNVQGIDLWFAEAFTPIADYDGNYRQIFFIAFDVTEMKNLE